LNLWSLKTQRAQKSSSDGLPWLGLDNSVTDRRRAQVFIYAIWNLKKSVAEEFSTTKMQKPT
jgi:hypothetical protein